MDISGFKPYRATRWQTLIYLRLPAALPYFLRGVRIGAYAPP
jgi:NitT/TauT family transport system permease protein